MPAITGRIFIRANLSSPPAGFFMSAVIQLNAVASRQPRRGLTLTSGAMLTTLSTSLSVVVLSATETPALTRPTLCAEAGAAAATAIAAAIPIEVLRIVVMVLSLLISRSGAVRAQFYGFRSAARIGVVAGAGELSTGEVPEIHLIIVVTLQEAR